MDSDKQVLWTTALRSGEYQQARGAFIEVARNADGEQVARHCCLAVLTEVAIKNGCEDVKLDKRFDTQGELSDVVVLYIDEERDPEDATEIDEGGNRWFEYEDGELPEPVARWAGITGPQASNPYLDGESAITLNDVERRTFDEIADAIEGGVEGG